MRSPPVCPRCGEPPEASSRPGLYWCFGCRRPVYVDRDPRQVCPRHGCPVDMDAARGLAWCDRCRGWIVPAPDPLPGLCLETDDEPLWVGQIATPALLLIALAGLAYAVWLLLEWLR
jgi:hypothetical protein